MEKPYLRKIETIDDFEIWEVDGMYIRNNVNREFTNFGQHYRFPFIPKHEFWIDKENSHNEVSYFVDHMILEWNLMNEGMTYDDAIGKADAKEIRERKKSSLMLKVKKELEDTDRKIPKEIYVQRLSEYAYPEVWIINGELVRDMYFIDFTEGGHHFVYDFVPHDEVWLDDDLTPKERGFVLLHELHERYLMYKGQIYNHAHNSSSFIEYKCRRKPELLKECINVEIEKNKTIK